MKIAIVKLSAMGDIIHAMVVLQFIKKHRPDIQIDWIVEESFAHILNDNPDIDNILTINLKSIKKSFFNIFSQIRKIKTYSQNNYDLVIDASGLIKSAIVTWLLGKHRVGFDKNSIREKIASYFYTQKVNIAYEENVIIRNIKVICEPLYIKVNENDILNKEPFLFFRSQTNQYLSPTKKNILLILGASKANKIYPKEKFLEISKTKEANFITIWANDFEKQCADFIKLNNPDITICDKLTLDELKSLICNVDLVIGGDTGPTHIAWALNKASITIFGNTPQTRNTYLTNINKVVKSDSVVDANKLDKNDFSIYEIKPETILKLAFKLLKIAH